MAVSSQEKLKRIKKDLGNKDLGYVTVNMCIGGMRGIPVRKPWAWVVVRLLLRLLFPSASEPLP